MSPTPEDDRWSSRLAAELAGAAGVEEQLLRGMRPAAQLPRGDAAVEAVMSRLAGRRPAVFLDYDGTLTPIVDRPEEAVMSERMREAVRGLARRCPVCVVSGRDRAAVEALVGVDGVPIAGSHGFDISFPGRPALRRDAGASRRPLIRRATERLERELRDVQGAVVEPKAASVAAHYRLVREADRPRVAAAVEALLADHPGELRVTPGRMVYEVQPDVDWHKGMAVRHLLSALELDEPGVAPLYLGDDVTDEDAFREVGDRGAGVLVGRLDDPELSGRMTSASALLETIDEVERLLRTLAGGLVPGEPIASGEPPAQG